MNREDIIQADGEFLVVYKPAGIAVQTARVGQMDVEHWLMGELAENGRIPYLAVVHRLDQPVEGLLVFARNRHAAAGLSEQMRNREMKKEYLAVVWGKPDRKQGRLSDFLKKDGKTNCSRVVPENCPGGKRAELEYECLQTAEDGRTLIRIRLLTGRHHQIRVQLAHAGIPIAGDRKYGGERAGTGPLGLCACALSFRHPRTGLRRQYRCVPRGEQFQAFDCAGFLKD